MAGVVVLPSASIEEVEVPENAELAWKAKARVYLIIRLLSNRSGGAERLFCEMANMLANHGYDVTCLYCDSKNEPPFYPLSTKVARTNLWHKSARRGLLYRLLDWLSKRGNSRCWAPIQWLSQHLYFTRRLYVVMKRHKPDVVISFLPPANTPTLLAGMLSQTRIVPTTHNVPEHDFLSPLRWDQNPVDRWLRRWALRGAARIHVLFPTFAEWFPDPLRARVVPIPNYVGPQFSSAQWPSQRRKEIIGVGRLAPVKNYMALIEAWAAIAYRHLDWSVKIFGDGPQRILLEQRIRELRLESSVQLIGHVQGIDQAYLSAEVLCHPALHEGFGLSVAEALACGLPVVAYTECEGIKEFVRDGINGLTVSRDGGVPALSEALDTLLTDTALRERLRSNTAATIAPFTQDAFLKRWSALIDDVVAE